MRVERVADPAEHRLVAGPHLAGRLLLAADGRQLGEQLLLARVEPGRRLDDDGRRPGRRDRRAGPGRRGRAAPARCRTGCRARISSSNSVSTPSRRRPRRRPRASAGCSVVPSAAAVIGTVTVQCRSLPCRVNVSCSRDPDLDVQVAGRAAAGADLALLGELDAGAGVDAGGDLDGEGTARPDPAVAGALAARLGDDRAEAAAGRARPQRADLAEERPLHVGHLAGAAAGLAGDRLAAGRGAVAVAGRAEHGGVDLELAGDAERRLGQLDLDPDQGVLAAAYPRSRPATRRLAARPERRRRRRRP